MKTAAIPRISVRGVALAGLAGAVSIDLCISIIIMFYGSTPIRLSQWDASNILGKAALSGGLLTATVGFALHLVVSFIWAAIAALVMLRLRYTRAHPVIFGILFGFIVMLIMHYVVVPLGKANVQAYTPTSFAINLFAHTVGFGIPVSLILARSAR